MLWLASTIFVSFHRVGVLSGLWVGLLGSGSSNDVFYFIAYGAEVVALSFCALSSLSFDGVTLLQASLGYTLGGFIRLVVSFVV